MKRNIDKQFISKKYKRILLLNNIIMNNILNLLYNQWNGCKKE